MPDILGTNYDKVITLLLDVKAMFVPKGFEAKNYKGKKVWW